MSDSPWTYADFEDEALYPTAAARLARYLKHKTEVREAIHARVTEQGISIDPGTTLAYLTQLEAVTEPRLRQLAQSAAGRGRGRVIAMTRRR